MTLRLQQMRVHVISAWHQLWELRISGILQCSQMQHCLSAIGHLFHVASSAVDQEANTPLGGCQMIQSPSTTFLDVYTEKDVSCPHPLTILFVVTAKLKNGVVHCSTLLYPKP